MTCETRIGNTDYADRTDLHGLETRIARRARIYTDWIPGLKILHFTGIQSNPCKSVLSAQSVFPIRVNPSYPRNPCFRFSSSKSIPGYSSSI